MRNVPNKSCGENKTHMFGNFFFLKNRFAYEIMWKNPANPERPQMTIWCMGVT